MGSEGAIEIDREPIEVDREPIEVDREPNGFTPPLPPLVEFRSNMDVDFLKNFSLFDCTEREFFTAHCLRALVPDAKLPFPVKDELITVQDVVNSFVAWPKDMIKPASKKYPEGRKTKKGKAAGSEPELRINLKKLPKDYPGSLRCLWIWVTENLESISLIQLDVDYLRLEKNGPVLWIDKTQRKTISWLPMLGVPEQFDSTDCGFFIMRYMKDIVEDKNLDFSSKWRYMATPPHAYTPKHIDEVKVEWVRFLMKYHIK
ncbi:hypothetical protein OROMI_011571 [Orobanche minor]